MNIVVFDGYVNNPGDLSWDALKQYGTVTVYDRTPRNELQERARQAGHRRVEQGLLGRRGALLGAEPQDDRADLNRLQRGRP